MRYWLVVIQVAPVGGHGAGGESAVAGPDVDGFGEPGGGAAAEFGDVEEPAAVVGEQPGKQHLVPVLLANASLIWSLSASPGMKPDRSASSPGASLASSRLASGTTIPMRMGPRPFDQPWRPPRPNTRPNGRHRWGGRVDGFPGRLAVGVEALQVGAEEFTGVGVDVLNLQPAAADRRCGSPAVLGEVLIVSLLRGGSAVLGDVLIICLLCGRASLRGRRPGRLPPLPPFSFPPLPSHLLPSHLLPPPRPRVGRRR